MKKKWIISLAAAAPLLVGLVSIRPPARSPQPIELPPLKKPAGPGETVAISRAPEEIFRRAFWRRPTASDRIVHADRREWSEQDQGVQRWQWFLQVRPSAELLLALRDPATFGLFPSAAAPGPVKPTTAPAWFPSATQLAGCEILQSPSGSLTVYYRAADNVLFAIDAGRGFAPPVTQVANR